MTLNEELKQHLLLQMKNKDNDLLLLRDCLIDFKNRGMDEERMYVSLEELRAGSDEETEDLLLELMDFVRGFCNPELSVF